MKRITIFIALLISTGFLLKGQEFYLEPGIAFHYPLTTQISPEYFTVNLSVPSGTNFGNYVRVPSSKNKFSLAKGFSYGATLGYSVNKSLGFEVGLDYFRNVETYTPEEIFSTHGLDIKWDFKTINSIYALVLGKDCGNYAFKAKAGGILGLASFEKSVLLEEYVSAYKLSGRLSIGYTFGLEFDFHRTPLLSFVAECGIENIFYSPKRAKMIENDFSNSTFSDREYIQEINYVNKIDNKTGRYIGFYDVYLLDDNETSQRLSETLNLNSVYLKIGIVYNLRKNEKN